MRPDYRSEDRDVSATFRMHAADKLRLKQDAAKAGLTMQQLFELKMLGEARPRGQDGRPRKPGQLDELPLTG
jgi:hypothetical protein